MFMFALFTAGRIGSVFSVHGMFGMFELAGTDSENKGDSTIGSGNGGVTFSAVGS